MSADDMNKIATPQAHSKPLSGLPSLFGPPALQRRRDRTGELVEDDPDPVQYVTLHQAGDVGAKLAAHCLAGHYRRVASGFIFEADTSSLDPLAELEILTLTVRAMMAGRGGR